MKPVDRDKNRSIYCRLLCKTITNLNASVMGTYHFLPVRSSSSSFIHPLASVSLKLYHLNYMCKDSILMRFQGKLSRSMKRGQMSVCSQVFTKFLAGDKLQISICIWLG